MNSEDILVKSIGHVKSPFNFPEEVREAYRNGRISSVESEIHINEELQECLFGIEEFSHVWVLFHIHQAKKTETMTHPMGDKNIPEYGIFATRSQYRPNHIGLRLVEMMEKRKNILKVKGLDAINKTPVIDIKPYIRKHDSVDNPKEPGWKHIK